MHSRAALNMPNWQISALCLGQASLLLQQLMCLKYQHYIIVMSLLCKQEVTTRKQNPGDLVIVNIQSTPLDKIASIRIFAKCDDVSRLLAKKLSLDIPSFHLHRLVHRACTGVQQLLHYYSCTLLHQA